MIRLPFDVDTPAVSQALAQASIFIRTSGPPESKQIRLIRAFKNPSRFPIAVMLPNGEYQHGDTKCYICAPVDPQNLEDLAPGKRYIMSASDFNAYQSVDTILGSDWRDKIQRA